MLHIWKDTKKLCNPTAGYTAPDGSSHHKVPADLYEEIQEDPRPDGFSDEFYSRHEDWNTTQRPYITYEPKPLAGIKDSVLAKLKAIRQQTLDGFVKSAGVAAIYDENLLAAQRYQVADTTPMRNGQTPEQYLAAMATNMGITLASFVSYIVAENAAAAQRAAAVERVYLDYAYTKLPTATFDQVKTMMAEYQAAIAAALS